MKALIFDNKVVDVAEKSFEVHKSMVWMDAPDECIAGWSLKNGNLVAPAPEPEKTYADKRREAYDSIGDQLDMQYHDQLDGTTTWKDAIAKVKSDNPKSDGWKE